MLPPRRREIATGNNFTFSNPTSKESKSMYGSEAVEYETWAERIKGQYNHFTKPSDTKFGAWTRRNSKSKNPDEDEFRWLAKPQEDEDSGTPSPEMWKKEGLPVIHSADSSPVRSYAYYNGNKNFNHVSYSARAQTIAKYRQEMLDMVRGMPETAYELSLRDIVESPKITMPLQEPTKAKSEESKDEDTKKKKEGKKERRMSRNESMETRGLFLRTFFIPRIPSVLGGRKSTDRSGTCTKVSPRPALGDAEKSGSENSTDREWWSAEFGQTSSGSSNDSINSSGRRRRSR